MSSVLHSRRQRLLAAGACALALAALPGTHARADNSSAQVNLVAGQAAVAAQSETVVVKAQRRLLKEKNSPSAVTELGQQQIATAGVTGSTTSLLRQAPSVNVYQQGIGDNAPEVTIRGLRGLEIATTLDGIPTQDLEAPGAFYLANNLGSPFTLGQISGVSIYPGVAYPNKNTFGTIGGTIAYDSKRPSNDFGVDVFGEVGSFQTFEEGFTLNSGAFDSPLGTGDNAAKAMLQYANLQTAGYIDYTKSRENEMEAAFDKPYNDGLSKFQATVLYNTGTGLIENEPVPVPYLNKNGLYSNYAPNQEFAKESNDYLTIILKNDTYVNDYLTLGLTAFYLQNDNALTDYGNINLFTPAGVAGPATVSGASPFINNPAGFGLGGLYGPGAPFYSSAYPYNPNTVAPPGSAACPASLIAAYNKANNGSAAPCGINSELSVGHSDTYGIQPRAVILLPEVYGIANNIQIGGLFAKETSPLNQNYLGATPNVAQTPQNLSGYLPQGFDGGTQRTIFQAYAQDRIDLFDGTLHLTPGGTLEGTFSSYHGSEVFNPVTGGFGEYKANKWDREALPFFNVSYDFDKVLPAAKGLSVYGSIGNSALFAPVSDFGPNTAGPPPYASIVHLYEGGVKYNVSNLVLTADYFYQKVDRDFGYFQSENPSSLGESVYSNTGQREFKGFEAAATYQVTPNFQLFGNVSHVLAKYLSTGFAFVTVADDQYGIAEKGEPISGIPDWLSTFGADYTRKSTFLDNDAFDIRLTGQYTGHQATTYDINGLAYVPSFAALSTNAYTAYTQKSGATTYDPHGGISPFAVFNLDANYTLPTPYLPVVKYVKFDLNVQNLFDQRYFQYFYKQVSPSNCGVFSSGPFKGKAIGPYGCAPEFADGIPGEPFGSFFTVTAHF
jgi:iron complex outermembrane receptor protein